MLQLTHRYQQYMEGSPEVCMFIQAAHSTLYWGDRRQTRKLAGQLISVPLQMPLAESLGPIQKLESQQSHWQERKLHKPKPLRATRGSGFVPWVPGAAVPAASP